MKAAAVLLIFLAFMGVFGPCMIAAAEASVPHEDPNEAQSTLDALSFLTQYADIFTLMANGQYANASQLSEQLSHITVPDDLSYIINRYNNLTQQLNDKLQDLDTTLDNASRLLDQYRLDEARQALDHAGVVVAEAQILLNDLVDATATVSQKIGVFSAAAGSKIQQAYSVLQSMLDRLQELIDRYHQLLQQINQQYETQENENLKATSVTLSLNATECFVGGYLSATGTLTSGDQVLANRAVTLLLDGAEVSTVNTDSNGTYYGLIHIPYSYVNSVSIRAYYAPAGTDKGTYLGSTSPTIVIKVLYYRTVLNVSAPTVAYPGLSLTVSGTVSSQSGVELSLREIKVLLDGDLVAQDTTDANGTFVTKSTINASTKLGNHTLTVTVAPSGVYAGASITRTLAITKVDTTLEVSAPSFVMLPAQLRINGTVKGMSGLLSGATVLVEFAGTSATTQTLSDGSFNLTVDVPFSGILAGDQPLKITVQPAQSWQAATSKNVSVFVLNSVSLSLMSVSSLAVVLVLYFRFARGKSKKAIMSVETQATVVAPKSEVAIVVPTVVAERKLEGLAGKIVKAYIEAISAIQSTTSIAATPTMTLREYFDMANPKLRDTTEAFSRLTALAEITLYSTHPVEESAVNEAEELANIVRRKLNGAT
jgi:hypothetical protein